MVWFNISKLTNNILTIPKFRRMKKRDHNEPLILCLSKPTTGSAAAGRIAEEAALGHALGEEAAAVGYELREAREEASGVGHASMD